MKAAIEAVLVLLVKLLGNTPARLNAIKTIIDKLTAILKDIDSVGNGNYSYVPTGDKHIDSILKVCLTFVGLAYTIFGKDHAVIEIQSVIDFLTTEAVKLENELNAQGIDASKTVPASETGSQDLSNSIGSLNAAKNRLQTVLNKVNTDPSKPRIAVNDVAGDLTNVMQQIEAAAAAINKHVAGTK